MARSFKWALVVMLLVAGWGSGLSVAGASDTLKIGFIDAQKVLDDTKLGKKAKTNMEEYRRSREKVLEIEQKDLKELEESLLKQSALLSPQARKDKQEEYQRKVEQFQRKLVELNREVQDKQLELIKGFRRELESVVKNIAEKEGYDYILDRDNEGGNILYAKDSLDITDRAILELDKATQ